MHSAKRRSTNSMVYDWESHKDTIRRLYVDEGKQVDSIMEYMRVVYDFKPRFVWLLPRSAPSSTATRRDSGPNCLGAPNGLP